MAEELRIRRELTLVIEGPKALVDELATYVTTAVPVDVVERGLGQVRFRMQGRMDVLDDDWQVIPPGEIVAAFRRMKAAEEGT